MTYESDAAAAGATRRRGFLEICVETLAGAKAAIAGGADQIELCSALALGGLTPSHGLVERVLAEAVPAGVRVRTMVRPRAGGFDHDADDLAVLIAEAQALKALGVDGLVMGLTQDGTIDHDGIRALWDSLGDDAPDLTFHRAIDTLVDPVAAVEPLIRLGFDQILTSGGARNAPDGANVIRAMVGRANERCRIVAGAGVRTDNAPSLIRSIGTAALHGTARDSRSASQMVDPFGFGSPPQPADIDIVRALRAAVDNAIV